MNKLRNANTQQYEILFIFNTLRFYMRGLFIADMLQEYVVCLINNGGHTKGEPVKQLIIRSNDLIYSEISDGNIINDIAYSNSE